MKGYIFLCVLFTTFFTFGQSNGLKPVDSIMIKNDAVEIVLREQKTIDSLRNLREKEIKKQDSMLKMISFIKKSKTNMKKPLIKYNKPKSIETNIINKNGIKPNDTAEYWEETIQRTWFGRQLTGQKNKIRIYTYENGIKVYKD